MQIAPLIFWILLAQLLYSYIGYGIIAGIISFLRTIFKKEENIYLQTDLPEVTIIIPAYNEVDFIQKKIENTLQLDYPQHLLQIICITDGSTDGTNDVANTYHKIITLHSEERKGKMAAINRAMLHVTQPIVVFSDANTLLNTIAIREIVKHYSNEKIGGVAGEKKIVSSINSNIVGEGEGLYWKYESAMKQLDSDLYTVVAAAGELFSLRTKLFKPLPNDTLIDDLVMAVTTCKQGFTIAYEKNAYAIETPSVNLKEERKRKIRIAAGAAQAVARLGILPSSKDWMLNFQYFSRRIIRWIFSPISLPILFILNLIIVQQNTNNFLFSNLLIAQVAFYTMALIGWVLYRLNKKSIFFFAPFYFVFMNVCMFTGFVKYILGKQTVNWEKAKRITLLEAEHAA